MTPDGDESQRDARSSDSSPPRSAPEEARGASSPHAQDDTLALDVVRDALREAAGHLGQVIKARAWSKTGLREGRALLKRVWTWEQGSETSPDDAVALGAALVHEINRLMREHGSPILSAQGGDTAMGAAWCQALSRRHSQWRALKMRAARPHALMTRLLRAERECERRVERAQRFLAIFGLKLEGMERRRRGPPMLPASWGDDEHEAMAIVEKQGRQ